MRDSPVARGDDDNPVVNMKRYRRVNEVAAPSPTLHLLPLPTPSSPRSVKLDEKKSINSYCKMI
jgi:hypothetical protein